VTGAGSSDDASTESGPPGSRDADLDADATLTETSDADSGGDDEAIVDADMDAACNVLGYLTTGCEAAPSCIGASEACAMTFCGCDGLLFVSGCGWASKSFVSTGIESCPGTPPDGSACPPGTDLQYTEPGCDAGPSCQRTSSPLLFGWPPAGSSICGCDEVTVTVGQQGPQAPYVSVGACASSDK
jgi:hypothetical protein